MHFTHNNRSYNKRTKNHFKYIKSLIFIIIVLSSIYGVVKLKNHSADSSSTNKVEFVRKDTIKSTNQKNASRLSDIKLFVDSHSNAATQADLWRLSKPSLAAAMDKLAALPTAKWFTSTQSLSELDGYLAVAQSKKSTPVLVAYNLPHRDCGRYSSGGANDSSAYLEYINLLADKVGSNRVLVVLEPDALASIKNVNNSGGLCLTDQQQASYYSLLSSAIIRLKSNKHTSVYLDAGNSAWITDVTKMSQRLRDAGIDKADGFSLNVSNFQSNDNTITYGQALSDQLTGIHYIVDTSRNGLGVYVNKVHPEYSWCNPPGRALGHFPTTDTGDDKIDAFLYIKYPGESDGEDIDMNKCFGGQRAGLWMPEYGLGLLERWPKEFQAL